MGLRLASARLAAQLQEKVESHFYGDTAAVLTDAVTSLGSYGQANVTTTTTPISCNFTDEPKLELWKNFADVEMISAEIRFAAPAPKKGNRVTLKGRFDGTSYVDTTYEIIDIKNRDAFGYVCALKVVQI